VTLQAVGERLGIGEQFLAVDELRVEDGGALRLKERVEGGQYLVSVCAGPPAVVGWATGNLPEPPNNPQTGMQNMRSVMPALQRAAPVQVGTGGAVYASVAQPQQRRQTRVVRDLPPEQVARELVDWIRG
jgi:electron transfer flavoprotein beta subunit